MGIEFFHADRSADEPNDMAKRLIVLRGFLTNVSEKLYNL
jgi:hypothetical protein